MRDSPSAEALFASLHGRIYSATRGAAEEDRMITGHGGWDPPTSITIWLRLGGKSPRLAPWSSAGVEVETMLVPYPPPEHYEHSNTTEVISRAISPPDLTFPLTLTVERSTPKIPVDGRDRIFTTYTCGNALVATARVGELHLRLKCQVAEFQRGFAIRSLSQAELEQLVDEYPPSKHVPSWWWEDEESEPDEPKA